jgi:hypothetical protein
LRILRRFPIPASDRTKEPMAKKKAAGRPSVGTRIRVRPGVTAPEFPDVPCAGWTGSIADTIGKKPVQKYVIEWDRETIERMPPSYVQQCEEKNLLHTMSCLARDDFDVVEE